MQSSSINRVLQYIFGIILLILTAITIAGTKKLKRKSENNSSATVDGELKSLIVGLTSGTLTIVGHSSLYFFGKFFLKKSVKLSDLNSRTFGLPKKQLGYLSFLSGSEISSVVLWFASFIYQTSVIGSCNCDNEDELLKKYSLDAVNSTESITPSSLLDLSSDCKMRKGALSISALGFFTYLISSSLVATSGYNFWQALKKAKNQDVSEFKQISVRYSQYLSYPDIECDETKEEIREIEEV